MGRWIRKMVHDFAPRMKNSCAVKNEANLSSTPLVVHPSNCSHSKETGNDAGYVMTQLQGIVMIAWRLIARTERDARERDRERRRLSMRRVLVVHFCDCWGLSK